MRNPRYWLALLAILGHSAALAQESFDILEYRVLGNSTLPTRAIEAAVYPHLGENRSLADVESARASLENAYRAAGFATVFVDIPEQSVDSGIVRLRATEGKLDRVRINGARYFSSRKILAAIPTAQPATVPHFPSLQTELADVNRRSVDRSVTPVLKPGLRPGTVDLELKIKDDLPLHGGVEVNNRYTADTTELRANVSLSYNNLFNRFHSLALQYQFAPEKPAEVDVIAGTYTLPWGDDGKALVFSAIRSDTNVAAAGTLGVLGRGNIFGARALWPVQTRNWSHTFVTGVDFKDVTEIIRPSAPGSTPDPVNDVIRPVKYSSLGLSHSAFRRTEKTTTILSLGANLGLRRLPNSSEEFGRKRSLASPNFFYLRGAALWNRDLPASFQLRLRGSAQYAVSPLISNEQFSIGGLDTVRGYLDADQFGDIGFAGSVEIGSPSLLPKKLGASLTSFFFYDAGVVSLVDVLCDPQGLSCQPRTHDLAAAGIGFRFTGLSGLEAALDWAYPLVPSNDIAKGEDRIHFSFKYSF